MYKTKINSIATPITLDLKLTRIYLCDYILNPENIQSFTVVDGIEIWENKMNHMLALKIVDSEKVAPISTLDITFDDNTVQSIVLIKSKKIIHPIRFYGMAHSMQIAGDFNSWNPKGYDFEFKDNCWQFDLEIEPGNYSYQLIVNDEWIKDPLNSEVIENGYGGYNSLLRVPFPSSENELYLEPIKDLEQNIVISIRGKITHYVVLWENIIINEDFTVINNNTLVITIPEAAKAMARSFIRVFACNATTTSNDLLIPLTCSKKENNTSNIAVTTHAQLTRDDKEAQVIYFALLDRFFNGSPFQQTPISNETDLHAKLNFHGGNIRGLHKKLKEGYFTNLGITSIWVSPIVQNPIHAVIKNGQKSAGYHGYWPLNSCTIDARFGNDEQFKAFIDDAHKAGINIILDYVANHVYKDNPIILEHPDWSTPLILPDGSKNIARWETERYTTWFEEFLPTLDYSKPEVIEQMTNIALDWVKRFDLDGFRHDATKHIQSEFWRMLTKKIKEEYALPNNKRFYQIGETFGGREMLKSYINSGLQDGQFSFNLYYEARSAFLYENVHFEKLCTCLRQELLSFGYNHLMGNISGNHDMPRFISYAGEDLWMNQNAEHEGWARHITVKNPIGYSKLILLHAFNCTIPGIPVIYYGDEIGMPGGGDPDNRRPMKFTGLQEHEQATLTMVQDIVYMRTHYLPLIYGTFEFIRIEQQLLIYKRVYFDAVALVIFNKSCNEHTVQIPLENIRLDMAFSFQKNNFKLTPTSIEITLPAMSFDIIHSQPLEFTIHNNEDSMPTF
ncbi:MAG: hypothetical protein LBR55_04680 [Bacteroidales bacterium]|jgi:glycosidase|nr:hypothetical protein [Bacteroidales bacterium]